MNGEDRRDDVLLYVSGVLDGPEGSEVERYLAEGGPRAAGELAEAEATLAHLALSLDPLEPPERVKRALLERVKGARPRLLRVRRSPPQPTTRLARGILVARRVAPRARWAGLAAPRQRVRSPRGNTQDGDGPLHSTRGVTRGSVGDRYARRCRPACQPCRR